MQQWSSLRDLIRIIDEDAADADADADAGNNTWDEVRRKDDWRKEVRVVHWDCSLLITIVMI